jgi:hypothetical protein
MARGNTVITSALLMSSEKRSFSASRDDGLPPASRRERVIPALTDHLEDKGGVIGPASSARRSNVVNPSYGVARGLSRTTARFGRGWGAQKWRQLPQSSSASRFTAGAFGFLTLTQWGERPER